jgi:hypothetical protein
MRKTGVTPVTASGRLGRLFVGATKDIRQARRLPAMTAGTPVFLGLCRLLLPRFNFARRLFFPLRLVQALL